MAKKKAKPKGAKAKKAGRSRRQSSEQGGASSGVPPSEGFLAAGLRGATANLGKLGLRGGGVNWGDAKKALELLAREAGEPVAQEIISGNRGAEDAIIGQVLHGTPRNDYGLLNIHSVKEGGRIKVQGMDPMDYFDNFWGYFRRQARDPNSQVTPELVAVLEPAMGIVKIVYENRMTRFGHLENSRTTRNYAKMVHNRNIPDMEEDKYLEWKGKFPPAWQDIIEGIRGAAYEDAEELMIGDQPIDQDGLDTLVAERDQLIADAGKSAEGPQATSPVDGYEFKAPQDALLLIRGHQATQKGIDALVKDLEKLKLRASNAEEDRDDYLEFARKKEAEALSFQAELEIGIKRYTVHGGVLVAERSALRTAEEGRDQRLKEIRKGTFDLDTLPFVYTEPDVKGYGKRETKVITIGEANKELGKLNDLRRSLTAKGLDRNSKIKDWDVMEWGGKKVPGTEKTKDELQAEVERLDEERKDVGRAVRTLKSDIKDVKSGNYTVYLSFVKAYEENLPPDQPVPLMLDPDQVRIRKEDLGTQIIQRRRIAIYAQAASESEGDTGDTEIASVRWNESKKRYERPDGTEYICKGTELIAKASTLEKQLEAELKDKEKRENLIVELREKIQGCNAIIGERDKLKSLVYPFRKKFEEQKAVIERAADKRKKLLGDIGFLATIGENYIPQLRRNASKYTNIDDIVSLPGMEMDAEIAEFRGYLGIIYQKTYDSLSEELQPIFEKLFTTQRRIYFENMIGHARLEDSKAPQDAAKDSRGGKRADFGDGASSSVPSEPREDKPANSAGDDKDGGPTSVRPPASGGPPSSPAGDAGPSPENIPLLVTERDGVYRKIPVVVSAAKRQLTEREKLNISVAYNLVDATQELTGYDPKSLIQGHQGLEDFYLGSPLANELVSDFRQAVLGLKDRVGKDPELVEGVEVLEAELVAVEENAESASQDSAGLAGRVKRLEYDNEATRGKLRRAQERIASSKDQLRVVGGYATDVTQRFTDAGEEIVGLTGDLKAKTAEVEGLRDMLSVVTEYATKAGSSLADSSGENARESGARRAAEATVDDLRERLSVVGEYATDVTQRFTDAGEEIVGLTGDLKAKTKESDDYRAQSEALAGQLDVKTEEAASYEAQSEALAGQLDAQTEEANKLAAQLRALDLEMKARNEAALATISLAPRSAAEVYLMNLSSGFIEGANDYGIGCIAAMLGMPSHEKMPSSVVRAGVRRYKALLHGLEVAPTGAAEDVRLRA